MPARMKYLVLALALVFSPWSEMMGQAGLEGVLIERYYIADANDVSTPFFPVPSGATTYRVYIDMAPDWELQAIFGATNASTGEIDTFLIRSTTPFFNNEDRGRAFGYLISSNNLDENTVALDSWFTTGRSGSTTAGVVKPEDTNGGLPAFPNLDGLLQNNDPDAGIPISESDGNIPLASVATWTLIGITLGDLAPFNDINLAGNEMIITDGALTSFGIPLQGANPTNKVLIGQFTTAGTFIGKLNLQMRNSNTGEVQQWVAESPGIGQFTSPALSWAQNNLPEVMITSPGDGTKYLSGEVVSVTALASDPDSAIHHVEFFFEGTSVGIDDMFPFQVSFIAARSGAITAIATGDVGGQATSAPVLIEVNPYRIGDVEQYCTLSEVCMPLQVFGQGIEDVVGFDLKVTFDVSRIYPTGNLIKSDDLLDAGLFEADYTIDLINGEMLINVFLNSLAPLGSAFAGTGDILCIEFNKRPAMGPVDSTIVWAPYIRESFVAGGTAQHDSIPPGTYSTMRNTAFQGSLAFWADNSPVRFDPLAPMDFLITEIAGVDANCDTLSSANLEPDLDGGFTHDIDAGGYLSINRDIAASTDVQPVINSFDAFLVRRLLVDDPVFDPSVFQMIAMDVNRDGVISAGDVSQINQRSVLITNEFRQAWNYSHNGTPAPDYQPSKDWLFIPQATLDYDPAYRMSSNFPEDNGVGYSRFRVPQVPFCLWTGVDNRPEVCPEPRIENYIGVLLGDVNGNYKLIPHDGVLK
jgi:hypothetical protein